MRMQMVSDEYNDLFAGQVVAVEPVHETTKLEKLVAKYEKSSQKLWDMIGDYSNKKRNGKKIKRKQVHACSIFCKRCCVASFTNTFLAVALAFGHHRCAASCCSITELYHACPWKRLVVLPSTSRYFDCGTQ